MRRIFFSLIALSLSFFTSCSKTAEEDIDGGGGNTQKPTQPTDPTPPSDPQEPTAIEFVQALGIGWNLGNSLDAHSNGRSNETCWGNGKATQATFNAIKAMGFSSVRIPVTWMGHIGAAPEYQIEKTWLDRVAEVIGYARNAGLKAVINIHHDGAAGNDGTNATWPTGTWLRIDKAITNSQSDTDIKAEITKVWTQIATRFQNEGDWLIFETFNEIHDGKWGYPITPKLYAKLNEWNQTAVDAIRATGGNNTTRYIAVPCYAANPTFANTSFKLPTDKTDNRLIVAVHSYDPYDYAGAGNESEWGHTGRNTTSAYQESHINNILEYLKRSFLAKGVPVYFGEFGCVHRSTQRAEDFRKYYLEYNIKNMREHKIPVMIWDNGAAGSGGEKFGLVNHANGTYVRNTDIDDAEEVVKVMVKAWNSNDESYTLKSIYDKAP